MTMKESAKFKKLLPELHRDTGPKVIPLIMEGVANELWNDLKFGGDEECEWSYTIDVDKETVTVKGRV